MRPPRKKYVFLGFVLILLGIWMVILPSNDRNWSADQAILPYAEINGNSVLIRHVRSNRYRSTTDYDVKHEDRTYNLSQIESVWFIVEPFSSGKGVAHTFLSFGFENGDYVGISIEIRKEKGEKFSWYGGLFKRFELTYVAGDERDLIGLRANMRKDDVYLYRGNAPKEKIRALFLSMLDRMNKLHGRPEFYNTLTNTCTTIFVRHIGTISETDIPWNLSVLLPATSDKLAYDLGLLDTSIPFEELKAQSRINDLAAKYADDPAFSQMIRRQ
ncbi:MAG: DUF4105 domain-containing protein [Candidatus Peribacteraceae bacterium]|nr:DUF4105 domain-containing protein [Candidatus Peribacteraceae bacterium]